jgi:hypothetical protein
MVVPNTVEVVATGGGVLVILFAIFQKLRVHYAADATRMASSAAEASLITTLHTEINRLATLNRELSEQVVKMQLQGIAMREQMQKQGLDMREQIAELREELRVVRGRCPVGAKE